MQTSRAADLRDQLIRFLASETTLDGFDSWLVSHTWDSDRSGDEEAAALAHELDLCLAEYAEGAWSGQELRARLSDLAKSSESVGTS